MLQEQKIVSRQWQSTMNGIDNLECVSTQVQRPGHGEILVKINSVSINFKDGEVLNGQFKHHKAISLPNIVVPCSDAAGTVFRVGSGVTKWKEGDRVVAIPQPEYRTAPIKSEYLRTGIGGSGRGVLCEYRIFQDFGVLPTPSYLSDDEACALGGAGITAWMAINGLRTLGQPGGRDETILLQGTGGVSINGLLIAKASGAKVIITSSSDEKLQRAKALGADHLINYRKVPDWDEEVLRITEGRGVDNIFENGGTHTTSKSLNCVALGGLINAIGYVTGKVDSAEERTNINVSLISKNALYKGHINGPVDRIKEYYQFCEKHQLRPIIDRVYQFEEAVEALQYLWSGSHFGKVVIKI